MNLAHLSPLFVCYSIFAYGFDFAEIFAFAKNSAVSLTQRIFLYDTAESELFFIMTSGIFQWY